MHINKWSNHPHLAIKWINYWLNYPRWSLKVWNFYKDCRLSPVVSLSLNVSPRALTQGAGPQFYLDILSITRNPRPRWINMKVFPFWPPHLSNCLSIYGLAFDNTAADAVRYSPLVAVNLWMCPWATPNLHRRGGEGKGEGKRRGAEDSYFNDSLALAPSRCLIKYLMDLANG